MDVIRELAQETISELVAEVCEEASVSPHDIYEIAVAGNATMVQLLLGIDPEVIRQLTQEKYSKKQALLDSNQKAIDLGFNYAKEHYPCPLPIRVEAMDATKDCILIDGNTAAALGCVYAGATVGAW